MNDLLQITPTDVTELEREQLRFFLAGVDPAPVLVEINPSLAWLPTLAGLDLFIGNDSALAAWVGRNLNSEEAVREVVANLSLFRSESAQFLEHQLNRERGHIKPLLLECWRLILRHIRNEERGRLQNEWFELLPRVRSGDLSSEVLGRLAFILAPKLSIEKRYGWYDEPSRTIVRPTDLFSIRYRVEYGLTEADFLGSWRSDTAPTTEAAFLGELTVSLEGVLRDAREVDAESNTGLSASDIDVPSVAQHEQNAHRQGFLPIVRIMAELWSRLVHKDIKAAQELLDRWTTSAERLLHRLALYSSADPLIPPSRAADTLLRVPAGELFVTQTQVEVLRLLRMRWAEFGPSIKQRILKRIVEGPPLGWFRDDKLDERMLDRLRFDLLVQLERIDPKIAGEGARLLGSIRKRYPKWQGSEPERAGFVMWSGSVTGVIGEPGELSSVASEQLVAQAQRVVAEADMMAGDAWQGLCQAEPLKAFLGIEAAPQEHRWHQWAWRPLFWSAADKIADPDVLNRMARLFTDWPDTLPFDDVANGASFWLERVSDKLKALTLWKVWDLLERRAPRSEEKLGDDPFSAAINDVSGHLATVLLKRTNGRPRGMFELNAQLQSRYDKLTGGNDRFAILARLVLSQNIAYLFERAPLWSKANILPLYQWTSPDAPAMWSARKYARNVGSSALFDLTKKPLLELLTRRETPDTEVQTYAEWIAVILLAKQGGRTQYNLTFKEVRSVLRGTRPWGLASFAHRLAVEMQSAKPGEKMKVWSEVIKPVFHGAWPLDAELQTKAVTFKLVQLLLATGAAFSDALAIILPFVRAEDHHGSALFSLSEADEALFKRDPDGMLRLLSAVVGNAAPQSVFGLNKALTKLTNHAPHLAQTKAFQRLTEQASIY